MVGASVSTGYSGRQARLLPRLKFSATPVRFRHELRYHRFCVWRRRLRLLRRNDAVVDRRCPRQRWQGNRRGWRPHIRDATPRLRQRRVVSLCSMSSRQPHAALPRLVNEREPKHLFFGFRDLLKVVNHLYGTTFEEASEFSRAKKGSQSLVEFAEKTFGADDGKTRCSRRRRLRSKS